MNKGFSFAVFAMVSLLVKAPSAFAENIFPGTVQEITDTTFDDFIHVDPEKVELSYYFSNFKNATVTAKILNQDRTVRKRYSGVFPRSGESIYKYYVKLKEELSICKALTKSTAKGSAVLMSFSADGKLFSGCSPSSDPAPQSGSGRGLCLFNMSKINCGINEN